MDEQSVTLRKLTVAFVILLLGMAAAKYSLSTRFLLKSQFKETTASAVHKLMSYTAYLLVFLFALRMVNIPLTAFAFLGGAIAIGMGFGAQNLINNFISGFMIIGERREIESNVRFKIDQLFSEAGLVIAFPQRDVHLDTLKPLQINIEHGPKN